MIRDVTYTSGPGGRVTVTGTGGENNASFTYSTGGFDDGANYNSNMKNGQYWGTTREEKGLGRNTHILTNDSTHVEGIYENMANVRIDWVGDRYYQDSESAHAYINNIAPHMAQRASSGKNEGDLDINKLISRMNPINMKDLTNKLSSVTATPTDLEPMPPADTIWNLPKAISTATSNQAKIEAATMSKVVSTIPLAQAEASAAQNNITLQCYEEAGETELVSSLTPILSSSFGSVLTPSEPEDSYGLTDDMLWAGLEPWATEGGIELENYI